MKKSWFKYAKIFVLAMSIAIVISVVYYLITDSTTCFLPYEPIVWIRIPEIIIGIIMLPVLIKIIIEQFKK